MPELRKDPIVGRWVVIAPERAKRPEDYSREFRVEVDGFDPFLEGNEQATPPEVLAYRQAGSEPNGPGWRVRVVPNKFPALQVEGALQSRGHGMYDLMSGIGAHEVVIECPHRETNMSRLSVENIREVFAAYRDRLADLKRDRRLVHAIVFKNSGAPAGATLAHSHSQLIVTPVVPISVQEEMAGAQRFYDYRGRCIFQDMIEQEVADGRRLVLDTPRFVAFCPFAARCPFEVWVVPKQQASHYEQIPQPGLEELAMVMKTVLGKLELALDDAPYNYVLHTAPFHQADLPHYRWHIEIFPRLTRIAGFEWGSGFYINPVPPEESAEFLRGIEVDLDDPAESPAAAAHP